jgi:hypothetical protein
MIVSCGVDGYGEPFPSWLVRRKRQPSQYAEARLVQHLGE